MVNSYNYPDGVSLHCLWNISVSSICLPQFNFKCDSSGRPNQILVFARASIVNFVIIIRNLNNSGKTLYKFRQKCASKVGKNNCAWKLSKPSIVAGTSFIWVGIFFRSYHKPPGTRNEHWLTSWSFLIRRSQKDSSFTIAGKKSLGLAWMWVFFSAAYTCLNEVWFLGLSYSRKRRAETRSRFTQPCLKPWERGWYFTRFNLLQVGAPHVLLAVLVFCELSLLAQNWKIKYEPVSSYH